MVLSGLFDGGNPEVSDSGYMQVRVDENLAEKGVVGGDIYSGAIIYMFDKSTSTALSTGLVQNGTRYLTVDLLRKYNKCAVQMYYSNYCSSSPTSHVVTIQISDDNSNWTDVSSISNTAASTEVFANYSDEVSFRYLRLKSVVTGFQGIGADRGLIYHLTVGRQ